MIQARGMGIISTSFRTVQETFSVVSNLKIFFKYLCVPFSGCFLILFSCFAEFIIFRGLSLKTRAAS